MQRMFRQFEAMSFRNGMLTTFDLYTALSLSK
jgi:hypothetical protein